jgi:Family of unknown function (DUF6312)
MTQKEATAANTPIVIETHVVRKKKYSSDKGIRTLQELEEGLAKSARKVAKSVQVALDTYLDSREASADAKKDGALRDLIRNQSKALRKALPIAAEAPADFLDAVADMKSVRDVLDREKEDDDDEED